MPYKNITFAEDSVWQRLIDRMRAHLHINSEATASGEAPDALTVKISKLSRQKIWKAARKRAIATGEPEAVETLDRKIAMQAELLISGDTDPEDFIFRPLQRALQQNTVA